MEHELKLQPNFFNYVKYGTKRIELRLYDEKRQNKNYYLHLINFILWKSKGNME